MKPPHLPEPVSPELALIDPELRRRLWNSEDRWAIHDADSKRRAPGEVETKPAAADDSAHRNATAVVAVVDTSEPRGRRRGSRARTATLMVGSLIALTIALIWVGIWATEDHVTVRTGSTSAGTVGPSAISTMPTEPVRPRAVSTTPARPATTGRSTRAAKPNHSPPPTTAHGGASARVIAQVERAVLGLLPAAARAGRVPKLLVDPGTGLLRSGTVIDCVLAGGRRYRCSVVAGRTTATLTASREPTGVISLVARHGGTVRGEA